MNPEKPLNNLESGISFQRPSGTAGPDGGCPGGVCPITPPPVPNPKPKG